MNTFEQLIGKEIIKIFRLDIKEDYDYNSLLALFLQLDNCSGLLIANGSNEMTTLDYITLGEVREEFGTEYYETRLNDLKPIDQLINFVGKTIQSIKVGQLKQEKFFGESFIISAGEYAGVIIEVEEHRLTIFQKERRQEISFDISLLFPTAHEWTLK